MRTYCRYILIALLLSCAVSCTTNDEMADPKGEGKMSLRLVSSAMTRASDEQHNEDFLDKVDLYLFGDTAEASKWHTTIDTDANGSITLNQENESEIYIPASALNSVGDSPKLYVIANYDNATSPLPESATLDALKKQVVAKASWGPTAETEDWKAQSSFVMEGLGDVTKSGNQLSGTVNLKRAAAKIDLSITDIVDQVEAGDYVWKPVVSAANALNVTLKNAVTTSYVGADWDKTYEYFGTNGSTVNYTFTAGTPSTVDGVTTTPYSQTYPFYSYSSDQAKGASETYMVLAVPWQMYKYNDKGEEVPVGDVDNLYYEVPIGDRDNKLIERNFHYKVSIYVGTLGSTNADESVELEPEITVVDWSTGDIAVDIKAPKYLVVDETVVNIYNHNQYDIAYASSDENVTAKIISITKPDLLEIPVEDITIYSGDGVETVTPDSSISGNKNTFTVTVDKNNKTVVLRHTLDNDQDSDSFDYYPYTIEVEVTNGAGMTQIIKYTQYPARYITPSLNSSYNVETEKDSGQNGYVIINNNRRQTSSWNVVNGLGSGSGSSSSPYMYVVTVTSFNDTNYVIGDPRSNESNTLAFTKQNDVNSTTLEHYYPTQTSTEYANYISPKFRICSGYGRLGSVELTKAEAEYRCASYQEDGYPAGRWRLPTAAELSYIGQLCAEGKIPPLFSDDVSYWSATGGFLYDLDNGTFTARNSADYVRCVYDDWYWGSDRAAAVSSFTWGDQER